jgi:hypothetical protein
MVGVLQTGAGISADSAKSHNPSPGTVCCSTSYCRYLCGYIDNAPRSMLVSIFTNRLPASSK